MRIRKKERYLNMNEKEFSNWTMNKENEFAWLNSEATKLGYAEGMRVNNEEEQEGNPFEVDSLDWHLFEDGKGQALNDW